MKRIVVLLLVAVGAAGCGGTGSGSGEGTSGVFGQVLLGPQCPVEQEGSPCPDQPTEAEVRVMDVEGTVVASERTDADGRFRISVEPGTYTIQAFPLEEDTIVFGKPQNVTVPEGEFAEANVSLDTGIR